MKRGWRAPIGLALLLGLPNASSADEVRRFALVSGSNHGAANRVTLRFAVSDAERFASLITQMGGVHAADCIVLREPSRATLLSAMATLRDRVREARQNATRTEVLLYYSGHADEKGLMLGRETLAYRELRDALTDVATDVSIAVLDACASGAITRLKGGQVHPAFLTDASVQIRGQAFLTSSSETEAAQESDVIQGSFFTHSLLSGLRGGADSSGDGKVTLGEAYQFAFDETLAQTTATQGGAQHPAYDIKMAGTGDVVLTDMREMSCSLAFDLALDGRFFVRNSKRQLVAELYKPAGRTVELGLEPGSYEVLFEQEQKLLTAKLALEPGQRMSMGQQGFKPTKRSFARPRGALLGPSKRWGLNRRSRIEMRFGSASGDSAVEVTPDEVSVRGLSFALAGSHWLRESVALDLSWVTIVSGVKARDKGDSSARTEGTSGFLFGVRYYGPSAIHDSPLRPYLSGAVGPLSRFVTEKATDLSRLTVRDTSLGGRLGGGVDIQVGRRGFIGVNLGWTLRAEERAQFSAGLGLGVTFGRGADR